MEDYDDAVSAFPDFWPEADDGQPPHIAARLGRWVRDFGLRREVRRGLKAIDAELLDIAKLWGTDK